MPIDLSPTLSITKPPAEVRYISKSNLEPKLEMASPHSRTKFTIVDKSHFPVQIESIKLPPPGWWTTLPTETGTGNGYSLEFNPTKSEKSTSLILYSAGVTAQEQIPERAILKLEPHNLTRSEKESISPELAKSNEAYTSRLNGKTCIFAQYDEDNRKVYLIKFNCYAASSNVFVPTSIEFQAKPAQYRRYINQVKECLKTIKWSDKVEIVPE